MAETAAQVIYEDPFVYVVHKPAGLIIHGEPDDTACLNALAARYQYEHGIKAPVRPQGTYMLFIDCEEYCKTHNVTMDELLLRGWKYGVYWQDGRPFHGEYSIRINLALPLSRVQEAFTRLKKYAVTD